MSRLSREPSGAECVVPPAAILAFAHVFLFWVIAMLDIFFMTFDVLGVLPETKGPSALTMMKLTNALFIAYMALRIASSGSVPRARRRTHRASYLAGAGLLVLMQLYLSTLGNLHWQGYHSYHAADTRLSLGRRIEHYTSAIRHCPGVMSEDELLGRAHAYRLIGEHARAVEDYDAYIRLRTSEPFYCDPEPSAYCGRAISLRELGRRERAREDFDSAMKRLEIGGKRIEEFGRRGPDVIAALLSRPEEGGKVLVELGDPESASRDLDVWIAHLDEGMREDGPNAAILNVKAIALDSQGKLEEALRTWARAVEIDPRSEVARINRASTLVREGRHLEAIEDLNALAEFSPEEDNMVCFLRAPCMEKLGRWKEAAADLTDAIERSEGDASLHARRGRARALSGDLGGALDDLAKAASLDPEGTWGEWALRLSAWVRSVEDAKRDGQPSGSGLPDPC